MQFVRSSSFPVPAAIAGSAAKVAQSETPGLRQAGSDEGDADGKLHARQALLPFDSQGNPSTNLGSKSRRSKGSCSKGSHARRTVELAPGGCESARATSLSTSNRSTSNRSTSNRSISSLKVVPPLVSASATAGAAELRAASSQPVQSRLRRVALAPASSILETVELQPTRRGHGSRRVQFPDSVAASLSSEQRGHASTLQESEDREGPWGELLGMACVLASVLLLVLFV